MQIPCSVCRLPGAQWGLGAVFPPGEAAGPPTTRAAAGSTRVWGPAGLEEQGWADLAHFGERVSAALSVPWVLAGRGGGSVGLWGRGMAAGLGMAGTCPRSPCLCGVCRGASRCRCLRWVALRKADPVLCCAAGPSGLWRRVSLRHPVHGVPGGSGMPGAPCTQSRALGVEPAAVLAVASVQRLALNLTATQRYG